MRPAGAQAPAAHRPHVVRGVAGADLAVVFGEGDAADPVQACLDRLPAVGLRVRPGSTHCHDLTAARELVLPALCSEWTLWSVSPPSVMHGWLVEQRQRRA